MTDAPAIGERGAAADATHHLARPSRRTPGRRSPTPQLQKALGHAARRTSSAPRASAAERLPEFEALRDARARHQEPHAGPSRPLSRGLRGEGRSQPAATCTGRATAEDARAHHRSTSAGGAAPRPSPRARSMIAEEIALNDAPRGERHRAGRDRSRRIHHPAARRAAQPHHRAGRASDQGAGRGRLPPRPHRSAAATATSTEPATLLAEARARAARAASSPPMSASPAPTS